MVKPFVIKPGQPGAPIGFTECVDGETVSRAGVIWSKGPEPSSVWVQPDDDPINQVLVRLPSKLRAERDGRTPEVIPGYPATWQRDVVRRCDAVARHGGAFGVVDNQNTLAYHYGAKPTVISYHTDPQCPDVHGKERYVSGGQPVTVPAGEVIDVLLGRQQGAQFWAQKLCSTCVYLVAPGSLAGAA